MEMAGGDLQAYCNVGRVLVMRESPQPSIRALSHYVKGVRLKRGVLDRIAAKLRSQREGIDAGTLIPAYIALYLSPNLKSVPTTYLAALGIGLTFWIDATGDTTNLDVNAAGLRRLSGRGCIISSRSLRLF